MVPETKEFAQIFEMLTKKFLAVAKVSSATVWNFLGWIIPKIRISHHSRGVKKNNFSSTVSLVKLQGDRPTGQRLMAFLLKARGPWTRCKNTWTRWVGF